MARDMVESDGAAWRLDMLASLSVREPRYPASF